MSVAATAAAEPQTRSVGEERPGANSILVVDDEANIRNALRRSLSRVGFKVIEASTAEEALGIVGTQPLLCAITDLRMPGMGGHGFVRECAESVPELPVIVLTGHGDLQDAIECMRQDVCDFLLKPWTESEMRLAIERVTLRRKRKHDGPREGSAPASGESAQLAASQSAKPDTLALILEQLRSGEIPLPSAPGVALEARAEALSDTSSVTRLKEVIERDGGLSGRIIRIANSGYYAGYGRVHDLKAAIARIGFREIRQLTDALLLKRFYAVGSPQWNGVVQAVWRHSWTRALAMRFLAELTPRCAPVAESAFLVGLFADVGAPFLIKVLTNIDPSATPDGSRAFIAASHCEAGAVLARAWELPPLCERACLEHHAPVDAGSPQEMLLFAAAGKLCRDIGVPCEFEEVDDAAAAMARLGIDPRIMVAARTRVERYLNEHAAAFDESSR